MESSPAAAASNESGSVPATISFPRRGPSLPPRSIMNFFDPPSTVAYSSNRFAPPPSAGTYFQPSRGGTARRSPPSAAAAASSTSASRGRKRTAEEMKPDDVMPRRSSRVKVKAELKKPPPSLKAPPPSSKPDPEEDDGDKKPAAREGPAPNCCICMCDIEPKDLTVVNGCDHKFCFECIDTWSARENTCPLCKVRFTKIERVSKKRVKGQKGVKYSKTVRERNQRADLPQGSALEAILASLAQGGGSGPPSALAQLMFSITNGRSIPPPPPFAAARSARSGSNASSPLELMDSDDEDTPFSLTRFLAQSAPASGRRSSSGSTSTTFELSFRRGPNGYTLSSSAMSANPPRSHASNANDANAGNAENPLEIDLESDDEVEIIAVRRPAARSSRNRRTARRSNRSAEAAAAAPRRAGRPARHTAPSARR